jgi:hypothetical protein
MGMGIKLPVASCRVHQKFPATVSSVTALEGTDERHTLSTRMMQLHDGHIYLAHRTSTSTRPGVGCEGEADDGAFDVLREFDSERRRRPHQARGGDDETSIQRSKGMQS